MDINSKELVALEAALKKGLDNLEAHRKQTQDVADKALAEVQKLGGVVETKTDAALKELGETRTKLGEDILGIRTQVLDLAQKLSTRPAIGNDTEDTLHDIIIKSPQWQDCSKKSGARVMDPVVVGNFHRHLAKMLQKTQIVNATGQNQPLVPDQRVPGIITPAQRRFYIRDLLPQARTTSNLIQFTTEASYTNNAAPQGGGSPGNAEGELYAESAFTFSLSNAPVVTIGHWIPASRQVLQDAALLQGHVSARLLYGLKLEEEEEILTGNGSAGTLNGLTNQATAYNRGVTNDTMLMTLLKAMLQVSLSEYEASGFVLNPIDWVENVLLSRDTTNRFIFADPHNMESPRVWGLPVVPTNTMTQGKFLCGAFDLAAQLWDSEDATIRISENVSDHFIRNMVAILCEERLALTVYRASALIYGNTSHAG